LTESQTTLILGIGNIIMGDDGFGIHVVQRLQRNPLPSQVRVMEGGVGGFNLLGALEGIERVIVVDVMTVDSEPGDVCLFKPGPDFAQGHRGVLSFHQVGIPELMQMWSLVGNQAEIFFLVTRPENVEWGTELSPPVQAAVEKAVTLLRDLCHDNFAILERSP
jgi:hydrogenase maturation protease